MLPASTLFSSLLLLPQLTLNANLRLNVDIHSVNLRCMGGTIGNQASLTLNIIPGDRIQLVVTRLKGNLIGSVCKIF